MNEYPSELVERAQFEINVFERVSADTGIELVEEVIRLRGALKQMTVVNARTWLIGKNAKGEG
jgi:hypothetical protein